MLKEMLKLKAWRTDISVECSTVYVKLASCYERMHQRRSCPGVEGGRVGQPSYTSFVSHAHLSDVYRKRHRSTITLAESEAFLQKQRQRGSSCPMYGVDRKV